MTIDEMIEVLQAYKEGKAIQAVPLCDNSGWYDVKKPSWDFSAMEYRIKPEKKIIPYETFEELYKDMEEHGGKFGMIVAKTIGATWNLDAKYIITGFTDDSIKINDKWINQRWLLNNFTWFDGSPCGKKVKA